MANPTKFDWVDPTTNSDGSAIVAGEITGYQIGIRNTQAAGSVAGTYPTTVVVSGATTTTEAFAALGTTLSPGVYAAAIQSLSTTNGNSAYSPEVSFTIAAPPSPPNPPTGFTVA